MALSIDAFTQSELAKISPWTFEQLAEIDAEELQSVIQAVAGNADKAQPMLVWLQATERCHSNLWRAIDAQG